MFEGFVYSLAGGHLVSGVWDNAEVTASSINLDLSFSYEFRVWFKVDIALLSEFRVSGLVP